MTANCNCNTIYRRTQYYVSPESCIALPIQSDNLTYNGPNLPYTGIKTCNTLTVALQKIDEVLGELISDLYDSTTTTTTSSSTTTTTTTIAIL